MFLGTPFMVRHWNQPWGKILHFLHTLVSAFMSALLLYFYTAIWFFFIAISNNTRTVVFVVLVGLALVMFVVVITVGVTTLMDTTYRGSNIYFASAYRWTDAMRTLVVHAGMLDEVINGYDCSRGNQWL